MELKDLKELAKFENQKLGDMRQRILAEHSASFNWLLASLLVINSAGFYSMTNITFNSEILKTIAFFGFYFGIILSLLLGWYSQKVNQKMIVPVSELEVFWIYVSLNGEFDEVRFIELQDRVKVVAESKISRIIGFSAAIAFSVSVFSIAFDFNMQNNDQTEKKFNLETPISQ